MEKIVGGGPFAGAAASKRSGPGFFVCAPVRSCTWTSLQVVVLHNEQLRLTRSRSDPGNDQTTTEPSTLLGLTKHAQGNECTSVTRRPRRETPPCSRTPGAQKRCLRHMQGPRKHVAQKDPAEVFCRGTEASTRATQLLAAKRALVHKVGSHSRVLFTNTNCAGRLHANAD